jgi:hypothetical protein
MYIYLYIYLEYIPNTQRFLLAYPMHPSQTFSMPHQHWHHLDTWRTRSIRTPQTGTLSLLLVYALTKSNLEKTHSLPANPNSAHEFVFNRKPATVSLRSPKTNYNDSVPTHDPPPNLRNTSDINPYTHTKDILVYNKRGLFNSTDEIYLINAQPLQILTFW